MQFTALPEGRTAVNNPITIISPVQSRGDIFAAAYSMRTSANFRTVFSESQNVNPLDAELETYFNAIKMTIQGHFCFGVNEEPIRGYIKHYNNSGLEC